MRKLVTIQEVLSLDPIDGADKIEVAKVLGWHVVVKKGEFKVGDKVVYAEVDSKFPEEEPFTFLQQSRYRVKTVKLRGQVSQGICFSLDILPEGEYEIDQEVTELLKVVKYESPISAVLRGDAKGGFPAFVSRTGETRIQVLQSKLTQLKGLRTVYTEKLDGTSSTFYLRDGDFGVCSKNLDLKQTEGNTYWKMADKHNIKEKLESLGRNLSLQGEIIGDGIQGNKYKLPKGTHQLFIFNIYDIDKSEYLGFEEFIELTGKLDIPTVPIIDDNFLVGDDIDELVELSKGKSALCKTTRREGIVIKGYEELTHRGQRVSFKVISPDFLLKYKE